MDEKILAALMGLAIVGSQAIIIGAFHFGFKAFKSWFMDAIIDPHVKPMQSDIKSIKDEQLQTAVLVAEHEKKIDSMNTWTLMLLGKVFGGKPNMSVMDGMDEPHTEAEVPLMNKEKK